MQHTQFKKGFKARVNIYLILSCLLAITFGTAMGSGLYLFIGFGGLVFLMFL
jgi:hypothetical protein